uniref:3'-5' exonuclease domain-containing protein n=1 Tax=Arcella intermedia TaxID=1963864 RepID=A0A6B2L2E8_9EUKA
MNKAMTALNLDLLKSKHKAIGLDTEWTSLKGSNNPLALLQLSSSHVCVLMRLCKLRSIPPVVANLLEDENILKAGVAIAMDAKLVFTEYGVTTRGCVDLQPLAHNYDLTGRGSGLKALSKTILNIKLNKGNHVRCGDWSAPTLDTHQIQYGALDAWVGLKILTAIYEKHGSPGVELHHFCKDIIDVIFTRAYTNKTKSTKNGEPVPIVSKAHKVPPRKSALYENCLMLAPNGDALCSINKKKVQWYLDRDLAELVQSEPEVIIKLKIEPQGRGHAGSEYYLAKKENKCVVCNSDKSYVRFSIIPHSYRRYMPLEIKDHSSHDIVLLCQECHRRASLFSESLRKKLKAERKEPNKKEKPYKIDNEKKNVRMAAVTLMKKGQLPPARAEELTNILKTYFQKQEITQADYELASKLEYKEKIDEEDSHEKRVVDELKTPDQIQQFFVRWRQHFLDTMKPQFLPTGWSLHHPINHS